jgi:uridine phosphorylase
MKTGQIPTVDPPHTVFFCFAADLIAHVAGRRRGRRISGFFGDLYLLKKQGGRVGVLGNFGLGAPVTAVMLSDLAAWGVRRFILLGAAGGLQPDFPTGSAVLATQAIRDEGTSHHYLPPARLVKPVGDLTPSCLNALRAALPRVAVGTTWTTDAPYRETALEIKRLQLEGVLIVEMEAAALFAAGLVLGVETAACLVVSDMLTDGRWQPGNDHIVQQSLQTLWRILLPVAAEEPTR